MHAARSGDSPSGLSPRVRGNLRGEEPAGFRRRSIPACAGKPLAAAEERVDPVVYPRVCGETSMASRVAAAIDGLSPRVRGNRRLIPRLARGLRSIPACAGKPTARRRCGSSIGVYPRVCGETGRGGFGGQGLFGLSPRVRGNLDLRTAERYMARSIPACAGKPPKRGWAWVPAGVYPRVCGETAGTSQPSEMSAGLSPRVRGNLALVPCNQPNLGSIPACAGKPPHRRGRRSRKQVYPRVCGETGRAP